MVCNSELSVDLDSRRMRSAGVASRSYLASQVRHFIVRVAPVSRDELGDCACHSIAGSTECTMMSERGRAEKRGARECEHEGVSMELHVRLEEGCNDA